MSQNLEDDWGWFVDIELNSQNTNRWKIKFEELTTNYNDKPKEFKDRLLETKE